VEALPSLPVRVDTTQSMELIGEGVFGARGLLRAEGDGLVLDLRLETGWEAGPAASHRIALADVSEVDFASNVFRTRLTLRPRRLAAFEGIPGAERGPLALRVARRDRALASRWATALSLALLEREG
jgi:hypothetical protein